VKFLLEHAAAGLFLDPGLGKTAITLAAIKVLRNQGLCNGVLVLAPLRPAYAVWPGELEEWLEFNGLSYTVLHGERKDYAAAKRYDVYIMNYEGLDWLLKAGHLQAWLRKHWVDTLVIDELSKFKHSETKRYNLLKPWLKKFARRWGLTGSPASNGLLNLFGQVFCLDLGRSFGQFITHFRAAFFTPVDDNGYVWAPKEGAEEYIYERLKPLVLRMAAEDYVTMPQLIAQVMKFELPPKARAHYDELEAELLTLVEQDAILAVNKGVANGKCRQIASGAVYPADIDPETGAPRDKRNRRAAHIHDVKLDMLEDLIDELQGQPLLVAYGYGHDLERILARIGKDTPYIGGGVSAKRGKELEDLWNAGQLPILLAHPQSMGHGLNLQKGGAHHICWFTLTYNFEDFDQFNRRLRRSGNTSDRVFMYVFMGRDTVEEDVWSALHAKRRTQQALFDALKQRAKARLPVFAGWDG
jgi:SNF2 family DNA or RNA helicase